MYLFLRFPNFKKKALTLSYDDGTIYDEKLVSIMKKHGIKGTFNLNSGRFGQERVMSEKQTVDLFKDSENEIAVHGVKHCSLPKLETSLAAKEILDDRENLERLFGAVIRGMAYAYGTYNDEVVNTLKTCGIHYARTVKSTGNFSIPEDWLRLAPTCHHNDPNLNEYVKRFLETEPAYHPWAGENRPKLFYLWGHSYEFADQNNWHVIEDFCEKVGHREDVWYATNGEIYDYVRAYNELEYSASQEFVRNLSSIDVYIERFGKKIMIPAGQTVKLL